MAKSSSSGTDPDLVSARIPPQLAWEFWNGSNWKELGVSGRHMRLGEAGGAGVTEFMDDTLSCTKSNDVIFRLSSPPVESSVNGLENYSIRPRITSPGYGKYCKVQQNL